jgi:hypothetical protein
MKERCGFANFQQKHGDFLRILMTDRAISRASRNYLPPYSEREYLISRMEIGLWECASLYFSCLLYVSSFDIDSARSP